MERIGYAILLVATVVLMALMVFGMVAAYPAGLLGLVILAGLTFLFAHVVRTRVENEDDDYYNDNIER